MSNPRWIRIVIGPCVLGLTLVAGCSNADQATTDTTPTTPAAGDATTAPPARVSGATKAIDKGGPPSGAAGTTP